MIKKGDFLPGVITAGSNTTRLYSVSIGNSEPLENVLSLYPNDNYFVGQDVVLIFLHGGQDNPRIISKGFRSRSATSLVCNAEIITPTGESLWLMRGVTGGNIFSVSDLVLPTVAGSDYTWFKSSYIVKSVSLAVGNITGEEHIYISNRGSNKLVAVKESDQTYTFENSYYGNLLELEEDGFKWYDDTDYGQTMNVFRLTSSQFIWYRLNKATGALVRTHAVISHGAVTGYTTYIYPVKEKGANGVSGGAGVVICNSPDDMSGDTKIVWTNGNGTNNVQTDSSRVYGAWGYNSDETFSQRQFQTAINNGYIYYLANVKPKDTDTKFSQLALCRYNPTTGGIRDYKFPWLLEKDGLGNVINEERVWANIENNPTLDRVLLVHGGRVYVQIYRRFYHNAGAVEGDGYTEAVAIFDLDLNYIGMTNKTWLYGGTSWHISSDRLLCASFYGGKYGVFLSSTERADGVFGNYIIFYDTNGTETEWAGPDVNFYGARNGVHLREGDKLIFDGWGGSLYCYTSGSYNWEKWFPGTAKEYAMGTTGAYVSVNNNGLYRL